MSQHEASGQDGHPEVDELLSKGKATISFFLTIPGMGILTACWWWSLSSTFLSVCPSEMA